MAAPLPVPVAPGGSTLPAPAVKPVPGPTSMVPGNISHGGRADMPVPGTPVRAGAPANARARLAAAATAGHAGVNAFDEAKSQIEQSRQTQLRAMSQDAALVGGAQTLPALSGIISAPALRNENALTEAGAVFGQQQKGLNDALDRYVFEAAAAKDAAVGEVKAKAAQALKAAKGGGSGGGGRRSGGSKPLTSSQIGSALSNAAVQNRVDELRQIGQQIATDKNALAVLNAPGTQQAIANVRLDTGGTPRPVSETNYGQNSPMEAQFIQADQLRMLAYQRQVQAQLEAALTRGLGPSAQDVPGALVHTAATQSTEAAGRFGNALQAATVAQGKQLYGQPLYSSAQQMGLQAGLDPALVGALVGPKTEKSLQSALAAAAPDLAKIYNPKPVKAVTATVTREALGVAARLHAQDPTFPTDSASLKAALGATLPNVTQNPATGRPVTEHINIVNNTLNQAQIAARQHLDFANFAQRVRSFAPYKQNPVAFELALGMAAPLFASQPPLQPTPVAGPGTGQGVFQP